MVQLGNKPEVDEAPSERKFSLNCYTFYSAEDSEEDDDDYSEKNIEQLQEIIQDNLSKFMDLEPKYMDFKFQVLATESFSNGLIGDLPSNVSNSYKLIFTLKFSYEHENVEEIQEEVDRVQPFLLEWGFVETSYIKSK